MSTAKSLIFQTMNRYQNSLLDNLFLNGDTLIKSNKTYKTDSTTHYLKMGRPLYLSCFWLKI